MKKFLKVLGYGLGVLVLLVAGLLSYVKLAYPKVSPADQSLKIEATPARLARGKYLAENVAACMGCHSQRDWTVLGHPVIPGTWGAGGDPIFEKPLMPGSVRPKNITPHNLGTWSDGEIVRALRSGVSKDGRPLFPFMPYQSLAEMEQEDLYSVIAYVRSLPSVANDVAPTQLVPPLNFIVHSIPKDAPPYPQPVDRKDRVAYGKYLVKIGGCADCHTPVDDKHQPIADKYLAGGQEFPYVRKVGDRYEAHPGGGKVRIPNLSPDMDTGIGRWSKAYFISRFADWRGAKGKAKMVKLDLDKGDYLPIMPYLEYSGMTDADLGAIYDYLRTIPAVTNHVPRFEPPKI
jgi:mono/diheme cytochrome c family protein